jgi:hypothetical protein
MNELSITSIDTNELKSLYFKSTSLILCEGTNKWKVAVNKELFVYDNVYDLTYCIQHEETKVAVVRLIPQTVDLKSVPFLECQLESSRGRY